MRNNCDVSGIMAECKGEKNCMYVKKNQDCIFLSGYGTICNNLSAIRAAIEAEHIVDANKMMEVSDAVD